MIPEDFRPGVVCHAAVIAGHLGDRGQMPPCLGRDCSSFWPCVYSVLEARRNIKDLRKTHNGRAVLADLSCRGCD